MIIRKDIKPPINTLTTIRINSIKYIKIIRIIPLNPLLDSFFLTFKKPFKTIIYEILVYGVMA